MQHIVLSVEQAKVLVEAGATVEVRDSEGRPVAILTPLEPWEIEAIKRWKNRPPGPRKNIPSEQVQAHLRRLAEIHESEGLDEEKMLNLLRRMQDGEQV